MATDPMKTISKSLSENTKAIASLEKKVASVAKRNLFDVDTLTNAEVKELRLLIEHESDVSDFSSNRIKESGDKIEGMYTEFNRLGLVGYAMESVYTILPMGHWAVEKHDQRERERKAALEDQRRFEKSVSMKNLLINGLFGLGGVILGAFLSWLLTGC